MLAGLWISFIFSLGTIYMDDVFQSLVFLFAGWAEGRIIEQSVEVSARVENPRFVPYRFERVYA
jgi:hypothetical protein